MPHSTRRRQKHSKLLNRLYPSYCGSGNGCSRTLGDVLRSWGISEVDKRGSTQEGTRKRRRVDESRSLEAVLRNNLVRSICSLWVVMGLDAPEMTCVVIILRQQPPLYQ